MINRLQFRHHDEVFSSRTQVEEYIESIKVFGCDSEVDASGKWFPLYAEPLVFKYGDAQNPNVVLAIGSVGSGSTPSLDNRVFLIDIAKTDESVEELREIIESGAGLLSLIPTDTDTVNMNVSSSTTGTSISSNVKIPETVVINREEIDNAIKSNVNGIYSYVNVYFDEDDGVLKVQVNDTENEYCIPSVKSGKYDIKTESLILEYAGGEELSIPLDDLIDEWTVDKNPKTPVVLTRNRVKYSESSTGNSNDEEWKDVLSADIRLATSGMVRDNILERIYDDKGNESLAVRGSADNITYWKNGQKITVKDALDNVSGKVSTKSGNIIYTDYNTEGTELGVYANVSLEYSAATNYLYFTTTNSDGTSTRKEFKLNSTEFIDDISYDSSTEEITIRYIDKDGNKKSTVIPLENILNTLEINNDGHTIELQKDTHAPGADILSADAKISQNSDNILEVQDHSLLVRGVASNIKYSDTESIQDALDRIASESSSSDGKIESISASTEELKTIIGESFTDEKTISSWKDSVENSASTISQSLSEEVESRQSSDNALSAKTEELEAMISQTSGDSVINVAETATIALSKDAATIQGETGYVIKGDVKISSDDGNIIIENSDGVFAEIDLSYDSNSNVLTFTKNGTQSEIQLIDTSVVENISYDKNTESLIITYKVNGETKTVTVPLSELIREWDVNNEYKNVTLSREDSVSGTDKLSASVNILESDDNLIESVDTGGASEHKYFLNVSHSAITNEIQSNVESVLIDSKSYTDEKVSSINDNINNISEKVNTVSGNVSSLSETVSQIASDVEEIQKDSVYTFTDTNSVDFTATKAGDGSTDVTAKVRVSTAPNNIIQLLDEAGLFAKSAELTYEGLTNKLTFTDELGNENIIELNSASFIDNIQYDESSHVLIIAYNDKDGVSQTVSINLEGLIKDTNVNNENTNITLHRDVEDVNGITTNIISAKVNVADYGLNGNILRNVSDGNSYALIADASDIISNIETLSASSSSASDGLESVSSELDAFEQIVLGTNITSSSTYANTVDNSNYKYISGATSLANADKLLNLAIDNAVSSIESMASGGISHSAILSAETNSETGIKQLKAYARLALATNQSEDSIIKTEVAEESEDNLLRIIKAEAEGHTYDITDPSHGLYFGGSIDYGTF